MGVNSDPLQSAEKSHGITLAVLRILQDRQYPCVLTSKYPHRLTEPEYLRALDGLPLAIQCSISSGDPSILARLEPGAPSITKRLEALEILSAAGAHPIIRLWPFIPDLGGSDEDLSTLLGLVVDAGVKTVLANFLKVYHSGGCRDRINQALGRDYLKTTEIRYKNCGLFSAPSYKDQVQALERLSELCRKAGLDLLSGDDWLGTRNWRDCCGVGNLPGFHPSPWAYFVRGGVIKEHCLFEEYMGGLDCPWRDEFQHEWDSGKLARAVPGLVFHAEDKTYSRITVRMKETSYLIDLAQSLKESAS